MEPAGTSRILAGMWPGFSRMAPSASAARRQNRWDVAAKRGRVGDIFEKHGHTWAFFRCFKLCAKKCVFYLFAFLFLLCVCTSLHILKDQANQPRYQRFSGNFWLPWVLMIILDNQYTVSVSISDLTNLDYHRIAPVGKYMHIPCSIDV